MIGMNVEIKTASTESRWQDDRKGLILQMSDYLPVEYDVNMEVFNQAKTDAKWKQDPRKGTLIRLRWDKYGVVQNMCNGKLYRTGEK